MITSAYAQPPPPPGGSGGRPCEVPPCKGGSGGGGPHNVPIDGGIWLLIVAGILLGFYTMKKKKNDLSRV